MPRLELSVSISAKFSEEARTLVKIARELGCLNRSELIREAVRFYLFNRLKPVVPVSRPREWVAQQQEGRSR